MTIFISAAKDCQIFYTVNGKNPITSGNLYTKGITLKEGTIEIKAVALNSDGDYSDVVSASYTVEYVKLSTPEVTPQAGTFAGQQTISINVPDDCTAYYSLDGTNPRDNGIQYSDGQSVKTIPILSIDWPFAAISLTGSSQMTP